MLRILFVGDIVGPPGFHFARRAIPFLRDRDQLAGVIVNAENAANGSGLTPHQYRQLRESGVDAVTLGDHIFKKRDIIRVLRAEGEPICRPANYPPEAPGRDLATFTAGGHEVAAVSLLGRTFMKPVDCPFRAADRVLAAVAGRAAAVVIDIHAEATGDKYLIGHHVDGRAAAALGTHTHVPTDDAQILPGGTAFMCDVGMTGPYSGVLGRRVDRVLPAVLDFVPTSFDVAEGDVRLRGAVVEIDVTTGLAVAVRPVELRDKDL